MTACASRALSVSPKAAEEAQRRQGSQEVSESDLGSNADSARAIGQVTFPLATSFAQQIPRECLLYARDWGPGASAITLRHSDYPRIM